MVNELSGINANEVLFETCSIINNSNACIGMDIKASRA
jgi:hypothetical protein